MFVYNNGASSACCGDLKYYNVVSKTCEPFASIHTDCKRYEINEGSIMIPECVECTGAKYVSNNHCCDANNYWNGTACAATAAIDGDTCA